MQRIDARYEATVTADELQRCARVQWRARIPAALWSQHAVPPLHTPPTRARTLCTPANNQREWSATAAIAIDLVLHYSRSGPPALDGGGLAPRRELESIGIHASAEAWERTAQARSRRAAPFFLAPRLIRSLLD